MKQNIWNVCLPKLREERGYSSYQLPTKPGSEYICYLKPIIHDDGENCEIEEGMVIDSLKKKCFQSSSGHKRQIKYKENL